jgi:hypothetical protein
VRTATLPDAEPLPALLPTTVGWRWPWLVATLVLTLTEGVLFALTFPRVFQFLETTQGGDYTAWVYGPLVGAFALSVVAGVVTMIVLGMRGGSEPETCSSHCSHPSASRLRSTDSLSRSLVVT